MNKSAAPVTRERVTAFTGDPGGAASRRPGNKLQGKFSNG
jgi:hypothetical protein